MSEQTPNNAPYWQAQDSHPDLTARFKDAMREIVDPEIGLNIIQLGLVRDLIIESDHALIKMILTTPFCPYGPAMLENTREKAEAALGMPTHIDLGLEPWDFSMMEEGLGEWGLFG
ncbi:MAG: iron-sulfur cluster assembly protein [Anaerolineae bacterium]|nr:iron-sulfur cluster assembly protein [Anaerolineae bacterium]